MSAYGGIAVFLSVKKGIFRIIIRAGQIKRRGEKSLAFGPRKERKGAVGLVFSLNNFIL
jgi:hypothetical protein